MQYGHVWNEDTSVCTSVCTYVDISQLCHHFYENGSKERGELPAPIFLSHFQHLWNKVSVPLARKGISTVIFMVHHRRKGTTNIGWITIYTCPLGIIEIPVHKIRNAKGHFFVIKTTILITWCALMFLRLGVFAPTSLSLSMSHNGVWYVSDVWMSASGTMVMEQSLSCYNYILGSLGVIATAVNQMARQQMFMW